MTHEEMDATLVGLSRTLDGTQKRFVEEYLAAHPSLGVNEAKCVVLIMSWAAEIWPAGTFLGDLARLSVVQVLEEDFVVLRRAKAGWDKGRASVETKLQAAEEDIRALNQAVIEEQRRAERAESATESARAAGVQALGRLAHASQELHQRLAVSSPCSGHSGTWAECQQPTCAGDRELVFTSSRDARQALPPDPPVSSPPHAQAREKTFNPGKATVVSFVDGEDGTHIEYPRCPECQ